MNKYTEKIIHFWESWKNKFFTFHLRPVLSDGVKKTENGNHKDTAIVIQGPIIKEKQFTFETVKIYKKLFPSAHIILSTWEDEDVKEFETLDIDILLNKKPKNSGISHINYQIVSTKNGINTAKKHGFVYSLKTRTDQRIYNVKALSYCKNLIKTFPIENSKILKGRIIGISTNTFKYRPYSISDMFLFGFTEDMEQYWDTKMDERKETPGCKNIQEWSQQRMCEVFLSTAYLEKMGEKLNWSISDSWKQYVDYFCIADRETLDLYWPKYNKYKEYRDKRYDGDFMNEEFDFADWLELHISKNYKNAPERLLSKNIRDRI
ncbi:hypothetical protein D4R99_01500 [bacterium]|nr:MAG: hypothetical protein D4R99_01500 [bacterium]